MARALVLLVVVIISFGLVVVASADPPDPTWIGGVWDDDDQDNAVIAILSIPGWVASADLDRVTLLAVAPLVVIPVWLGFSTSVVTPVGPRAPPLLPKHLS